MQQHRIMHGNKHSSDSRLNSEDKYKDIFLLGFVRKLKCSSLTPLIIDAMEPDIQLMGGGGGAGRGRGKRQKMITINP